MRPKQGAKGIVAHALHLIGTRVTVSMALMLSAVCASAAQPYPSKPIKFILPLGAESPIATVARLAAQALSARVGQPVIVENRPGGGGTIGTREVARAVPDGYTLLFNSNNHVFGPLMSKAAGYNAVNDFAPIATFATGAWILVVAPSVPAKSVKELISHANASPGKLNWGFGQATGPHLFGELLLAETGMDVARISYKAGPQAIPDMLGGRVQMNIGAIPALLPLLQEGKLRALAISSTMRSPHLPDVPTMAELGFPRLTRGAWSGLLAPARTSPDIIGRLNTEINASLASPELIAILAKLGFEPKIEPPQGFAAFLREEIEAWGSAVRAAGIQPN
jgi:tripartite-type tricarboxylate transporter receptor subunit TctC